MARKTANVTITDDGRDKGKTFVITEMPSAKAEAWAMKCLLALMAGDVAIPQGFERLGMAGLAELGIRALAGLKWEVAAPLLAEMWECLAIMPDPMKPHVTRPVMDEADDVEEVATRIKLRAEIMALHVDFLKAGALLSSRQSEAAPAVPSRGRNTKTSRP
jgi:hypothetical protein